MIEAIVIFKNGNQLHLNLAVSFEEVDGEIETNSKIGFIEFNEMDERIPSYMDILGKMLKKRAEDFLNADIDKDSKENEVKEIKKMFMPNSRKKKEP